MALYERVQKHSWQEEMSEISFELVSWFFGRLVGWSERHAAAVHIIETLIIYVYTYM